MAASQPNYNNPLLKRPRYDSTNFHYQQPQQQQQQQPNQQQGYTQYNNPPAEPIPVNEPCEYCTQMSMVQKISGPFSKNPNRPFSVCTNSSCTKWGRWMDEEKKGKHNVNNELLLARLDILQQDMAYLIESLCPPSHPDTPKAV